VRLEKFNAGTAGLVSVWAGALGVWAVLRVVATVLPFVGVAGL
jgi:hypothetical protein